MKKLAILLALFSATVHADDFPPLTNYATLARFTPLPSLGQYRIAHEDENRVIAEVTVTNEYASEGFTASGACPATVGECLLLDGETDRVALSYAGPLASAAEWRVEVPVLAQGGGVLDGFIETWHGWFGLPNGGRELAAHDQYHYEYIRHGVKEFDVTDHRIGLGDAELGVAWQMVERVVFRAEMKLPTGNSGRLTGGNGGGAAWFDAPLPMPDGCDGYSSLGASYANRGEVLADQQRRFVPFFGMGMRCPLVSPVDLYAQIYVHGALYGDSRLRELARAGAPLGAGLQYHWSRATTIALGILEDPSVSVSPDFGLQLAVTWR